MSHSGPGHVLPMSRGGPAHQGSAAFAYGPGGADLPCFALVCSGGMKDNTTTTDKNICHDKSFLTNPFVCLGHVRDDKSICPHL